MSLFSGFRQDVKSRNLGRLLLLSTLIGVVAGFGALAFNFVLNLSDHLFMESAVGYTLPSPGGEGGVSAIPAAPKRRWLLLILPATGALMGSLLSYKFAPEAKGEGTDSVIRAFHRGEGVIRARIPFVKTITSALTIGSGGSAGREGPIAQIGAGFGSALATWLKTSVRERRLLMLAGTGAGIGAVFRTPFGGAFYATEVLYRDVEFETAALIPAFVASIVSYSIYCSMLGKWGTLFTMPIMEFQNPLELSLYFVLGVCCALVGIFYVGTFHGMRKRIFERLPMPHYLTPAIGGLVLGLIAYFVPEVLGMGYGWLQLAINEQLSLKLVLALVFLKILATSLTVGSGGSGGMFAPSIVIGGLLGTGVGMILHHLVPGIAHQPAAFALVGMAGFFAGVSKTPVASLLMVSRMAAGSGLLVPLMLTTAVCYLLMPRHSSIYENQVDSRADSPAHEGEYMVDTLEGMFVRDAMPHAIQPITIQFDAPLAEILDTVANSQRYVFPVLDTRGEMQGVILFDDIRLFFTERNLPHQAVVAEDLLTPNLVTVDPDEDLMSTLKKFRETEQVELVIVEHDNPRRVVGILSRRDVLSTYQDRVQRRNV
jgi:chloride channel protein, CIC family